MATLLHPTLPGKGVYAITDGPRDDLFAAAAAALAGGARVLQYRDETGDAERRRSEADELSRLCAQQNVPFLVCDDISLAHAVGAGVHLAQDDASVGAARAVLGPDAIIGVSCYASLERARRYKGEGATYLSFGAMYPSTTLPHAAVSPHDVLTQAATLGLPLVAIGGITPDNGRVLIDAGADYLAAVSAIFGRPDIQAATRAFSDLFATDSGIL